MDLWQRSFDDYGSLGQQESCPQRMEGYPAVSGLGRNLANRLRTQFTR